MKERCKCDRKSNSLLKRSTLTEDDRKKNFEEFWKLNWEGKRLFFDKENLRCKG